VLLHAMAAECLKNCCRRFLRRGEQVEDHVIKVPPAPAGTVVTRQTPPAEKEDDYLVSKLPPDGKEVPFVVPIFRPSYIQPSAPLYPYQEGLYGSARGSYADRKAELCGSSQVVRNPGSSLYLSSTADLVSPGSARRPMAAKRSGGLQGSVWDLRSGKGVLSGSAMDLHHLPGHMQRYDSASSVQSSTSSMRDSQGSSRSLAESIALSGDERDLGKLNVRLSYQEAREQVWITLVQCKDLSISVEGGEQQKVGIKGVITIPKPVQFKSSIKEASPDVDFMETFVFALPLQQLRAAGLVLRVQTLVPRKRTLGECALSLRQLGPQQTQHWLELRPPSKAPVCHAELHLATCFQAVNGRIQFQVLGAQNISTSSAPLSQNVFVKVEMHTLDQLVAKKKTRVLRSSGGQVQWAETFVFPLVACEEGLYFLAKLYSRSSVRRKHFLGQVLLGFDSPSPEAGEQWRDTIAHPEKVVTGWHKVASGS
ncbi:tandem C2 domains nuclear protein, partial [Arapaima gigas]